MHIVLSTLLLVFAISVAIPTATLCIEVLAAFLRTTPRSPLGSRAENVAILIPARNEEAVISTTLASIKIQLRPTDILLVVADNCTDKTAEIATAAGATVVERNDTTKVGKGYALAFGVRLLESSPPSAVIVIDADCQVSPGAIDELAATALATQRPVQALYLMTTAEGAGINQQVAEFAWRVKNWVRPLGLFNLGLPCQLMGTGMAFPWPVIRKADLASGSIVEDLKLGLDLAATGNAPTFLHSARVYSQFASTKRGEDTQRQRWEHGHIATILRYAPRLFFKSLLTSDIGLLALTLDLAVPPLSLLAMLLAFSFLLSAIGALIGLGVVALIMSTVTLAGFVLAVGMAWRCFGREILPASAVASVPLYVLRKFGLYRRVLSGRETTDWVGTDRTKT